MPNYGIIGHFHFALGEIKIVLSKIAGNISTYVFIKTLFFFQAFI